jgi:AraC-like DNA-binding protein
MQLQNTSLQIRNDGFLPRHHYITCHHTVGNKLFGIKFKVCPIVFEKEVDFSEYTDFIYPLAYLIDKAIVRTIKSAASFEERTNIVFKHYESLISKHSGSLHYVDVVTRILVDSMSTNEFDEPVGELCKRYNISSRTLQRYFRATTSFSSKDALQTMRIRHAVEDLTTSPSTFNFLKHGYYDYSHFHKHLNQFTGDKYFKAFQDIYKSGKTP